MHFNYQRQQISGQKNNMENNSFSFFSFGDDDDISVSYPWDVGANPMMISYPGSPQKVEEIIHRKGKVPKISEEINIKEGGTSNVEKKIMHRDTERQRRQEMATLYASLRSVLPPKLLKGKRSISDQIHEATKHIRCVQNNIRKLGIKRDNIKRLSQMQPQVPEKGSCSNISPILVTVQPCSVGVEILISGDCMPKGRTLPVSRILQLLLEEGLVAVCSNWTKCDGSLNYVIQSEVLDYPGVNLQMLERKLNGMINNLIDIKQ